MTAPSALIRARVSGNTTELPPTTITTSGGSSAQRRSRARLRSRRSGLSRGTSAAAADTARRIVSRSVMRSGFCLAHG